MRTELGRRCGVLIATVLTLLPLVAGAATLEVAPVLLEMTPRARAVALTLKNTSDKPVPLQVRLFRWTQAEGQDQLTPVTSDEIVASPPMVQVAARSEQMVRIVLIRPASSEDPQREAAYRVVVDQLPATTQSEVDAGKSSPASDLKVLLRFSIPLFVMSEDSTELGPQALVWRLYPVGQAWQLEAFNPGARRVRLANLHLQQGDAARIDLGAGLAGYVLSGQRRVWKVPAPASLQATPGWQVLADTVTGAMRESVAVVRP